ncbi:hypothetical protein BHM03_00035164 [Ensete ventricosum]|nr:hypothetical protein BHM03_00035164 [Ensete ventricosum]
MTCQTPSGPRHPASANQTTGPPPLRAFFLTGVEEALPHTHLRPLDHHDPSRDPLEPSASDLISAAFLTYCCVAAFNLVRFLFDIWFWSIRFPVSVGLVLLPMLNRLLAVCCSVPGGRGAGGCLSLIEGPRSIDRPLRTEFPSFVRVSFHSSIDSLVIDSCIRAMVGDVSPRRDPSDG